MKTIDQIIGRLRREAMTAEQKQRKAAHNKKWRLANPEQVRKIHSDYYTKNRVQIAAKNKARYYARKEEKAK